MSHEIACGKWFSNLGNLIVAEQIVKGRFRVVVSDPVMDNWESECDVELWMDCSPKLAQLPPMDGDDDVAVFSSDSGSTLELLVDFELATVRYLVTRSLTVSDWFNDCLANEYGNLVCLPASG